MNRRTPIALETVRPSRREVTRGVVLTIGGVALGCGTEKGAARGFDAGNTAIDSGAADGSAATAADTTAPAWASGGTQAMSGDYADPFVQPATACVLEPTATLGPCTESADRVRKDISEGYTGLPMRLALQVVSRACVPIAGAKVKVWHTQIAGSYSGDTPSSICVKDAADLAKHYFRGVQTTDAGGRVDFDSCFPGWYPGRAIHVHYTVSLGNQSFTSQLLFDQDLVDEIFTIHPEYKIYGLPDTSNASDGVVVGRDVARYTVASARLPDGALMAAKRLVVDLA